MPPDRPRPDHAADEPSMLIGWLDFYRATLRAQVAGLDPEQLDHRIAPSTLTLGGLVSHLALVEDYWFGYVLAGEEPAEPWRSADWEADEDWDFTQAQGQGLADLLPLLDAAVERARLILERRLPQGLDQPAARTHGPGAAPSLRWILTHLIEEYARHAGHADLLRETIDGSTDL